MNTSTTTRALRRSASRLALGGLIGAIAILGVACSDDEPADAADDTTTATATSTDTATTEATTTATTESTDTATSTATTEASSTPPVIATTEMGEGESVHVSYECADGLTFEAEVSQVPSTWAIIEVDDQTIEMQQTISGSGIRYQGDGYEYQSKGDDATLLHNDEVIRADCVGSPSE